MADKYLPDFSFDPAAGSRGVQRTQPLPGTSTILNEFGVEGRMGPLPVVEKTARRSFILRERLDHPPVAGPPGRTIQLAISRALKWAD